MKQGVATLIFTYLSLQQARSAFGWSPNSISYPKTLQISDDALTRRALGNRFSAALLGGTAAILGSGPVAPAEAASEPKRAELARLQNGYGRVEYLLNHWDELTSICGKGVMSNTERKQVIRTEGGGGGGCEKTPLIVQDFLGYKSTEDPLFKADKLMVRAATLVDPDNFEAYLEVVEQYRANADAGALMAFTSSWGEANPNGGKEVVDDYLERTKVEVEETLDLLKKVLKYLELEIPAPLSKLK
jgi:hypothetical protein